MKRPTKCSIPRCSHPPEEQLEDVMRARFWFCLNHLPEYQALGYRRVDV
jgi:hypothetical protein